MYQHNMAYRAYRACLFLATLVQDCKGSIAPWKPGCEYALLGSIPAFSCTVCVVYGGERIERQVMVQVQLPESDDSTEFRVLDDVYSVRDFITGLVADAIYISSGHGSPHHTDAYWKIHCWTQLHSAGQLEWRKIQIRWGWVDQI